MSVPEKKAPLCDGSSQRQLNAEADFIRIWWACWWFKWWFIHQWWSVMISDDQWWSIGSRRKRQFWKGQVPEWGHHRGREVPECHRGMDTNKWKGEEWGSDQLQRPSATMLTPCWYRPSCPPNCPPVWHAMSTQCNECLEVQWWDPLGSSGILAFIAFAFIPWLIRDANCHRTWTIWTCACGIDWNWKICQKDSNDMLRLKTKYLQSTISTFAWFYALRKTIRTTRPGA